MEINISKEFGVLKDNTKTYLNKNFNIFLEKIIVFGVRYDLILYPV